MASNNALLTDKQAPIAIIGAGVFGLSSAIHLAQRGFTNITVFDRQPYLETQYDFDAGCDAASADCNKIIRASYGDEVWYQNLTLEAIREWEAWNHDLAQGSRDLPPGFTTKDRIYVNCGNYHVDDDDGSGLNAFQKASVENLTKAGMGHTQYLLLEDPAEVARAEKDGYGYAVDPFHLSKKKNGKYSGYLDAIGGFVYADKACRFALHRARRLGVKFVLDRTAGQFEGFQEEDSGRKVVGIKTKHGKFHRAALTIVACGGWTPTLLPEEMDGLCETTAGSLAMIQIPADSPLRQRFSPENFPVWHYKVRAGASGSLYGFPLDERNVMKLGYRGTKYTNPQVDADGKERSVPITRWTSPSIHQLPQKSVEVIRKFLDTHLPELRENGINITDTRLCWYTDSFDNHFVIDAVPSKPGVVVATGGSGHAFKFLPVIGRFVADRIEGRESDIMRFWRWRQLAPGEKPHNELMKGSSSPTALQNVAMSEERDLLLDDMSYTSRV